jgi:nitroreductase
MTRDTDMRAAIRLRTSVRSYSSRPVQQDLLERLLALGKDATHLTPVCPRIILVTGVDETRHILTHIVGSYGLVRNVPHLLVALLPEESPRAQVDAGYVLEQVVLEATLLGLGTCWITGTYDAGRAGESVRLAPGEVAGAVCAVGHAGSGGFDRLHDTAVRRLARGDRRKALTESVFAQRWGGPWSPEGADPRLVEVLECARLAPSAANRQPWRLGVAPGRMSLALARASYFDAGIVMAHVALVSEQLGRPGHWELRLGDEALARELALPSGAIAVGIFHA